MTALDLVTDDLPTLNAEDNALLAIQWLDEYKVKHLPVVDGNEYLGLITDSVIFDVEDPETPLGKLKDKLQKVAVHQASHIFHVVRIFSEFQLTSIAVLNDKEQYQGAICIYSLVRNMSELISVGEAGSIIELELNRNDYSLSEIAQIVEGNDTRILALYLRNAPDSTKLFVTIKITEGNFGGVLQTFSRYDYTVTASYQENQYNDYLQERYDELMRYLKM